MSSLTEPIHIIDGITNKVDKLAIVAFARQMIVKLCRDNPGKWVSVASYDPFSCGTSLFNINSRKKIFNPYGQHELQRNKNGAGKLSQQRILIVDGGFLYTERGQRGLAISWRRYSKSYDLQPKIVVWSWYAHCEDFCRCRGDGSILYDNNIFCPSDLPKDVFKTLTFVGFNILLGGDRDRVWWGFSFTG
jgi:hypothetical protein